MKQIIKETDSENGVGERPNIKLFGRYIANHAAVYGDTVVYYIESLNRDQIHELYYIARNNATQTNFGGDEYNWASWIRIIEGNYDITINAPQYFDRYMKRYSITIEINNSIKTIKK